MRNYWLTPLVLLAAAHLVLAQEPAPVALPAPQMHGGKPLMDALRERQTIREFETRELPAQMLSDLLWAAFGVNRPTLAHRTAPSAMNSQEVEIYVANRSGVYRYVAKDHQLAPVVSGDLRSKTGGQPFIQDAPLALIFVADLARLTKARLEDRPFYAGIDTGYISQNVYLYCASAGLGTVVHDLPDRAALAKTLNLRSDQKIILAQAVGFPKKSQAQASVR